MSQDFAHTSYAEQRRMEKAIAIETALASHGKTAADAQAMDAKDRRWFERVAGVRPCSDETWAKVAQLLEHAESSPARAGGDR